MSPYVMPGIKHGSMRLCTPQEIIFYQIYVCNQMDVPIQKMIGKTRKREVVQARQIAMYLAHKYGKFTLKAIGEAFGDRDHTTVIHSNNTVKDLCFGDEMYRERLEDMEQYILSGRKIQEIKNVA